MVVLLDRLHLNGQTLGSSGLEDRVLVSCFHLNGHTFGISCRDLKVKTTWYSIINSTTGKHYSCFQLPAYTRGFHPQK